MIDDAWLDTLRAAVEAGPGKGSTLLVAVSGGGDSVALLHGLAALREPLALRLAVAHLDHALRPDSAEDAAFVGQLALDLRLLCLRERQAVAQRAEAEGRNLEEAARLARYRMLESAAQAVGADAVVLAHTADDQAETVLMHLLRGAGLDGLKGMLPLAPSPLPDATVPLFRPLLGVTRAALRAWLRARGLAWREDATNADTTRLRSWLRHEALPFLEQARPGLRERLAQTATLLAADHAWLATATDEAWQRLAQLTPAGVHFERAALLAQPLALQRRLVRRAFFTLRPGARDLSAEQVAHALHVAARGENGARATLPGHLSLSVEYDTLRVGGAVEKPAPVSSALPLALPGPGRFEAEGLTVTVEAVGREALPVAWAALPPTTALLDAAALQWPLQLRLPEPGERWAPLGLGGQEVGLREWMAKHRVPPAQRDRTLLLTDAAGRVLWVVGRQVGHVAHVRSTSAPLLRVSLQDEQG